MLAPTSAAKHPTRPAGRRRSPRVLAAATAVVGALLLSACWSEPQSADLGLVNDARRANGVAAVAGDAATMQKAQAWSQHMARTGVLEHTGGGGAIDTQGIPRWCKVGENVGRGPTLRAVNTAFLRSPSHRANMLNRDYTKVGTGVVRQGDQVWVTEIYYRAC